MGLYTMLMRRDHQVRAPSGRWVRTARRGDHPTEPCPRCNASGYVWVEGSQFGWLQCALCHGRRRVVHVLWP